MLQTWLHGEQTYQRKLSAQLHPWTCCCCNSAVNCRFLWAFLSVYARFAVASTQRDHFYNSMAGARASSIWSLVSIRCRSSLSSDEIKIHFWANGRTLRRFFGLSSRSSQVRQLQGSLSVTRSSTIRLRVMWDIWKLISSSESEKKTSSQNEAKVILAAFCVKRLKVHCEVKSKFNDLEKPLEESQASQPTVSKDGGNIFHSLHDEVKTLFWLTA